MARIANLTLVLGLLAVPAGLRAQQSSEISIGERMTIHSQILGEARPYWVYLPASYDRDAYALKSYPVVYVLDGDAHFHSASGVVQFMSTGINGNIQIPEMIVVAIPNTNRMRDLTPTHSTKSLDGSESPFLEASGGGDEFLQFVSDELFRKIESTYRTLPYRIFVGHSLGGLLALHTLLEKPELFQAYIAIDPSLWWDDRLLVKRAMSRTQEFGDRRAAVYITLANNSDMDEAGAGDSSIMLEVGNDFAAALARVQSPNFRSDLRYFESEDHGSVPLLSLYHGLLFVFERYKPSNAAMLNSPETLNEHFRRISDQLGIELLPPGRLINQMGMAALYQLDDADRAIALFKLNAANYPGSSAAHASLGTAYREKGETALAIESFERSLELNPENEAARDQLDALTKQ